MLEGKNDYYTLNYFQDVILALTKKTNLLPGMGSGHLDTAIKLYFAWGREFIIILDSDRAGKREKDRYISEFGIKIGNRIFTLHDINSKWNNHRLEDLIETNEKVEFQKLSYPDSVSYSKDHFNRSIQEQYLKNNKYEFSNEVIKHFSLIFAYINSKLK